MRVLRVYLDTSVFGGCFDSPFSEDSLRLFELARHGRVRILMSDVVVAELAGAPAAVRDLLATLAPDSVEPVAITNEVTALRDAYIDADIVGPRWLDDAAHVAAATVARADAIVSWNFRHIVRLDKIRAYNAVNLQHGYGILTIISPTEVRIDEPDDE